MTNFLSLRNIYCHSWLKCEHEFNVSIYFEAHYVSYAWEKKIFLKFSSVPNMNVTGSMHCALENITVHLYIFIRAIEGAHALPRLACSYRYQSKAKNLNCLRFPVGGTIHT